MSAPQKKGSLQQRTSVFPFYPILFGLYPVLDLIALNISQIDFSATYRAIIFSVALSISLFGFLRLVMRSWRRAAFLTLLLLLLFFAYGHFYNFLKNPKNPGLDLVRHRNIIWIWIGLAGLSIWISTRKFAELDSTALLLNVIAAALLIYPAFTIVKFKTDMLPPKQAAAKYSPPTASPHSQSSSPDIYYIILDAYMRSDNIKLIYDYDNSAFLDALSQRGFYVANCSQSNYAYTEESLASSLNMDYLDKLSVSGRPQADRLIDNNAVRQFLKDRGYTIVALETGYPWTQWQDADVYYPFKSDTFKLNPFESLFLQTTLARIPLDYLKINMDTSTDRLSHDRIIYNLDILKKIPAAVDGPKFVFAHLVIPHWPYVYLPNGTYVTGGPTVDRFIINDPQPSSDTVGYPNAVAFIDKAMLQVVDKILADSKTPPIIIIQGDHGAFRFNVPAQRLSILNAYYLPGIKAPLYPTITPVNTFRILFNSYFGQNYALLEDISRFSPYFQRFTFEPVPNQCNP